MPFTVPWLFVHIPKTAGTSLRNAAERYFGDRILRDYGPTAKATSPEILEHVYATPNRRKLIKLLESRQIAMIAGHIPYAAYADLIPPEKVLVVLREPVQRVVSEYHHAARFGDCRRKLVDFAARPLQRNKQSLFVDGLDLSHAALVGLSERYADSLALLKTRTGLALPILEHNLNPNKALSDEYLVTEEEREGVRALNADDVILYDRVLALFSKTFAALGSGASEPDGPSGAAENDGAARAPAEAAAGSDSFPGLLRLVFGWLRGR